MVKWLKYTRAYFKLIRYQNLLIIAATMYLLRWCVIIPILKSNNFQSQISGFLFFLLTLATVCLAAAGYVINDYFDRKADLINRPGKVILGRILSLRTGMFWHTLLNIAGISLGLLVAYELGMFRLGFVFIIISGILWFYSTTYKRQVLLGNVMVALLVASVPLIILLFELPLLINKYRYYFFAEATDIDFLSAWIIGYAIFAFLLTLIREIIKDIEDFEGDSAFGRNTIPVAWGTLVSKRITISLIGITIVFMGIVLFKFKWSILTLLYAGFLIIMPLIYLFYNIIQAKSKSDYHFISIILKLIMLAGLFYTIVAAIWVF
jgi:4-hydroxybenzoate polyprenyltransferase